MTFVSDRQRARWYPLIDHPVQLDLCDAVGNGIRFPLCPSGRRSGKTERFKRFVVKQAAKTPGLYFAAAPTHNQAKKIFWQDLKDLCVTSSLPRKPSESDKIIYLPNFSEIHIMGLDQPERIEGIPWTGGGIDEFGDVKPSAWAENIFPALNTVDPRNPEYRAWCWLFGVPEGLNHYFDICDKAGPGTDFRVFHWKSADILPPDIIEAAKRTMSARQFRQEFEGSFETVTGRIYEDYGTENNTDRVIKDHEQLYWMHDQNYTPLSSAIGIVDKDSLYILSEIVLESAVSRQSAEEFVEMFSDHKNKHVYIYGDPAGRAGEKHGHPSDYTEIEDVLTANGWEYTRRVEDSHPAIKDRHNAVRAKILNAAGERSLFVNKVTAPWSHRGLATVQIKAGSTFQEDQKNEYQHITTAIGYMVEPTWPAGGRTLERLEIGGI